MATTLDSGELQKRYDLIEKAYCDARWDIVMEAGTVFLRDVVDRDEQPDIVGLRQRMQLLLAHTLLHGYGDRDAAEDLYETVRKSHAEPSLRQIAEDGLDQCHKPLTSTFVEEAEEEGEDGMGGKPELFLPESEQEVPPEAPEPTTPAQWLSEEEPEPPPTEPEPLPKEEPSVAEGADNPTDQGAATDPFGPDSESDKPRIRKQRGLAMPWLTPLEEVGKAEEQGEEPIQPLPPLDVEVPKPTLIPDVVEEPELMEVHQSIPSLADEVDVVVNSRRSGSDLASAATDQEAGDDDLRGCLLRVVVS
ncbi:MAG: hypothetical protein VKP70_11875 [Cyanobacteriota bacterium]|nr:hypothetical protein [Cyanobacteriota bacterium]